MRVLIAGASGVLGRPLIKRLRVGGHDVIGLARSESGAQAIASEGATPVVADALDRRSLLAALEGIRADVVVHQLTGYRNAPPTRFAGKGVRRTNALRTAGSTNLVVAAQAIGATRFVTQSLILGYGLSDHGTDFVTEDDLFGVLRGDRSDPSISAMAEAERIATSVDGIALRYGILYGPGASDMLTTMLARTMLPLPRRDTGLIGWVHIDDAVEATVAAVERGRNGRAYNIVDDEPVAWDVMLDGMASAIGARRPLRLPSPLIRLGAPFAATQMLDTSMRVSNTRAADELEWTLSYPSFRDGLRTLG